MSLKATFPKFVSDPTSLPRLTESGLHPKPDAVSISQPKPLIPTAMVLVGVDLTAE